LKLRTFEKGNFQNNFMIKMTHKFVLLTLLLQMSISAYSQKQTYVGINITEEWTSNSNNRHSAGFLFEKQITKHSGFETGIYLRTFTEDFIFTMNESEYPVRLLKFYSSIPISYKFYSKIVNVAAGITLDYYIGFHQRGDDSVINVRSSTINPKFQSGILLKASKEIRMTDKLLIEPEIRYNPVFVRFEYFKHYFGVGIAAKYTL
jgi:hypothetical protein